MWRKRTVHRVLTIVHFHWIKFHKKIAICNKIIIASSRALTRNFLVDGRTNVDARMWWCVVNILYMADMRHVSPQESEREERKCGKKNIFRSIQLINWSSNKIQFHEIFPPQFVVACPSSMFRASASITRDARVSVNINTWAQYACYATFLFDWIALLSFHWLPSTSHFTFENNHNRKNSPEI